MHWTTLEKILTLSRPPEHRLKQLRERPKFGPNVDWIRDVLESDRSRGEPLPPVRLAAFSLIWVGLAGYSFDALRRRGTGAPGPA